MSKFKHLVHDKYHVVSSHFVEADFKTTAIKFEKQGIDPSIIKTYIDKYKDLKSKNKIKEGEAKDIDFWGKKSFEEFLLL